MSGLPQLELIVARLRGPDGCPWDRAQDVASMRPYLLEECYELLAAMEGARTGAGAAAEPQAVSTLKEELGDLLFVLALVARICEERGWFSLDEAAAGIAHKMVVRHPHVFAPDELPAPGAGSLAAWEARKARELGPDGAPRSRLAGVPESLPALLRAHRQGEKAAAAGFDWPDAQAVLEKVDEELAELREAIALHDPAEAPRKGPSAAAEVEHELGDLLMVLADLGRHLGAPPESALQRANTRFRARFEEVERLARAQEQDLADLDAAALDALWEEAKRRLSGGGA